VSAFDELQRQLAESVAARAGRGRLGAAGAVRRWWRALSPSGPLRMAMPLLLVAAVGLASLARHGSSLSRPAIVTASAAADPCQPCRGSDGRVHGPVGSEDSGPELTRVGASGVWRDGLNMTVRWTSSRHLASQAIRAPVG
jgi:hypothetical protein